ncbi:MAG: hypothetical protein AAF488_02585 [Planctomycetota bacterium]
MTSVSGWAGKIEVVQLEYDPRVVSYDALVKHAKSEKCATYAFPMNSAQEKIARPVYGENTIVTDVKLKEQDTKYQLRRTPLKFLPMTRAQATRVNADVKGARTSGVLSPRQLELMKVIEAHPDAGWKDVVDQDFVTSWKSVTERAAKLKKKATSGR